ncbi:MAG: heme o synthase [Hydrotalea sp.]|nr:heme o synthase [Hydrotalea sp.]
MPKAKSPNANVIGESISGPYDYFRLLKPRVMSLVVFSAMVGLAMGKAMIYHIGQASGQVLPMPMSAAQQVLAIIFIAMGAGSAGALNMWVDRDVDSKMLRTMKRPLPQGIITPDNALAFGLVMALFSVLLLAFTTNYIAGGLLAFTIFYYVVVYSMLLKKRHVYNVVIGGVAGALPPVIGFVAVLPVFYWQAWLLFLVIFFWTPPHSWALAIFRGQDYQRAKIKMLPAVMGYKNTAWQMVGYSFLLLLSVLLFFVSGLTNQLFNYFLLILTVAFFALSLKFLLLWRDKKNLMIEAKKFFYYSIFYLFIFLLALLIDIW